LSFYSQRGQIADLSSDFGLLAAPDSRRLGEPLPALGYLNPRLRAVAPDMHLGIKKACVVEGASLDESQIGHDICLEDDLRPTFRAEVPANGLPAVAHVSERLDRSFH
jgi:hypothetical protein